MAGGDRGEEEACPSRGKDLYLTYRLRGHGWAEATISQDGPGVTLTASYLSDALGDLTAAVVALLGGAEEQMVCWEEEPGEYRWYFTRAGAQVRVRIAWVPDNEPGRMRPREEEVFVASCALARLAAQVRGALRQLLAEHGAAGYLAGWIRYPFPMADFQRLVEATRG